MTTHRRPLGVLALTAFFTFGLTMCTLTAGALLFPRGPLHSIWRIRPAAQEEFVRMGAWGAPLMLSVGSACGAAAIGLFRGRAWGRTTAIGLLTVNLLGDVANAFLRGDWRTLIGLPIAGGMIAYLWRLRMERADPARDRRP